MRRLYSTARGSQVPAVLLNGLQDEQLGLIAASDASTGATSVALAGADGRWWSSPDAGIADGELHVIDASVDWRLRRVWGVFRVLGAAARRPGAADDHIPNDPTAAPNARTFHGWTGAGGLGAAAATVANGTPPVIADNQYAVLLDEGASTADRVWLYARPADGVLCVYNDSGATLHAELLVWGAAAEVTAGAVPSVYPSPIFVLWLTPSAAADRPVTPDPAEQIALHRATDTGAITLWDGGAWRTIGSTYSDPLTTDGDLVVRASGVTARLGVGSEGHVLTVVSGAPAWAAAAAGGPVAGSGTFAARPATPGVGDLYLVSSGARLGSIYRCLSAGTWTLDAINWELAIGVRPQLAYDAEDLLTAVGGTVTRWRGRGEMRADLGVLGAPGGTVAGLAGGSSWGSLACAEWNDSGTSPRLRATVPGPLSTGARSLVIVASSLATSGTQGLGGWGTAVATGTAFNLMGRVGAGVTGLYHYALDTNGSGSTPTSDTPEVLVATYDGANQALYQAPITAGTPSWTTSIASAAAALVTGFRDVDGPLTLGGYCTVGVGYPLKGRIHGALVFPWALSSGERDALNNGLYARWQ